jgi:hypothetical protein
MRKVGTMEKQAQKKYNVRRRNLSLRYIRTILRP